MSGRAGEGRFMESRFPKKHGVDTTELAAASDRPVGTEPPITRRRARRA
jgi:hypothetical protein